MSAPALKQCDRMQRVKYRVQSRLMTITAPSFSSADAIILAEVYKQPLTPIELLERMNATCRRVVRRALEQPDGCDLASFCGGGRSRSPRARHSAGLRRSSSRPSVCVVAGIKLDERSSTTIINTREQDTRGM